MYISFDKNRLKVTVKYFGIKVFDFDTSGLSNDSKSSDTSAPDTSSSGSSNSDSSDIELFEADSTDEKTKVDSDLNESHSDNGKSKLAEADEDESKSSGNSIKSDGKLSIKERWNNIKPYFPVAKKALQKLLKLIRIYKLDIVIKIGDDDPYKAGMKFARINQIFYPIIALLCTAFTVKIKRTQLLCDYQNKCFDANGSFVVDVKPYAVLGLVLYLGVNYIRINKSQKKTRKKDIKNGREEK